MVRFGSYSTLLLRAVAVTLLARGVFQQDAYAQRVTGLDISAWQGNISQTTFNNI